MKKNILILIIIIILFGCTSKKDTPKKIIIKYLQDYQTLSKKVKDNINILVENEKTLNDEQKIKYKKILENHYSNIKYKIKKQQIVKDKALIITEIEVNNNIKVLKNSEYKRYNFVDLNGDFLYENFNNYKIDKLKNEKSKIKYELVFYLHKKNNNWIMEELNKIDKYKMLGIYDKFI